MATADQDIAHFKVGDVVEVEFEYMWTELLPSGHTELIDSYYGFGTITRVNGDGLYDIKLHFTLPDSNDEVCLFEDQIISCGLSMLVDEMCTLVIGRTKSAR